MKIEILSLFPEIFESFFRTSLVKKAIEKDLCQITTLNIRDFAAPPHFHVDDTPYGGGAGMLMKPEPLIATIEDAKERLQKAKVVLLSPAGQPFSQAKASAYSEIEELILVCGRYEGVDQRVIDLVIDEELSIGDYILMGGEVAAMVVVEASLRLVEDVLGNSDSIKKESFAATKLLEAPQYTRPPVFRDMEVPQVLLSGDHAKIEAWRQKESLRITKEKRPDLIKKT